VLRAAEALLHSAGAQASLLRAMEGHDIQALENALKDAEAAGVGSNVLVKARDRLCKLKEAEARAKAAEELQAAIDSGDLALLEAALAKARSLKVSEDASTSQPMLTPLGPFTVLTAAEALLHAAGAQASLFRAMEGHDIQVLEKALKDAEAAGVGTVMGRVGATAEDKNGASKKWLDYVWTLRCHEERVLRAAEALLHAASVQASLLRAMEGQDIQALENALKDAEAAGVGSDMLEKARDRLCELQEAEARAKEEEEELQAREEAARIALLALNELLAAMKLSDLAALQKALAAARTCGVSEEILQQGEQRLACLVAQQEADEHRKEVEAELLAAITADADTLLAVLLRAEAAKADPEVCSRAREALLRMRRFEAEQATEVLVAAMAGADAEALEAALSRAREAEVDSNLLQDAEAALQELRELALQGPQRREAEAELQAAIDSGDLAMLEAALAKARSLKVSEDVLGAAQAVLHAAEAQASLFRAMEGHDIQALMAALQTAYAAGVDSGYL
ncbi:unnamed protein product, partial [Symbiodinium pilosum]